MGSISASDQSAVVDQLIDHLAIPADPLAAGEELDAPSSASI